MAGGGKPFIAIRPSRVFAFNAEFVKKAELGSKYKKVTIITDPEKYTIEFKFHSNEEDRNAFQLYRNRGKMLNVTAQAIFKFNKWIEAAAAVDDPLLRRFKPQYNNLYKTWVINLAPSFENKVKKKSDVPDGIRGIYRYIRKAEIVYIGKGNIKKRVNSPERAGWEFDKIEYSRIEDPGIMEHWESFWIEKFYEREGRLPLYNKLAGQKKV